MTAPVRYLIPARVHRVEEVVHLLVRVERLHLLVARVAAVLEREAEGDDRRLLVARAVGDGRAARARPVLGLERVGDLLVNKEAFHGRVDRPEARVHRRARLEVVAERARDA